MQYNKDILWFVIYVFFLFTIHSPTTLFSKQGCWTLPISPILLVNPIETPLRTSWLCNNAADFGKESGRTLFVNFLWGNFHTKVLLTVMIMTHATWHQNLALEILNVLIFSLYYTPNIIEDKFSFVHQISTLIRNKTHKDE